MGSTRPDPIRPNPCGLGWTYVMGWVHHGGLGQKIPSTRPNLTHAHP